MTPEVPPPRRSFVRLVAWLGLATAGLFLLKVQLGSRSALSELQRESSRLKDELESRDLALQHLQGELRRFRQEVAAQEYRQAYDPRVDELRAAVQGIQLSQSNLFANVENMAVHFDGLKFQPETPAISPAERIALGIELLRGHLAERTAERLEIQLALVDQAEELGVPPEILTLPPEQALRIPAYRAYWPYFQLQEEYEQLRRIEDALRLRIEQEQIEARMAIDLPR
jgi:hypothetical protein